MKPSKQQLRAEHFWKMGQAAEHQGQWTLALQAYEGCVQADPADMRGWVSQVVTALRLGDVARAESAAREAHRRMPDSALTCRLLAQCLLLQHRFDEVVAICAALPATAERDAELLAIHGQALFAAGRAQEAVHVFLRSLQLDLGNASAHYTLGLCFQRLRMPEQAVISMETALATDKNGRYRLLALSVLVHEMRQACDWGRLAAHEADLLRVLAHSSEKDCAELLPFPLIAAFDAPQHLLKVGRANAARYAQGVQPLPPRAQRRPGRLRLGYLSADFANHATALLLTELLERHDRERFEVFLYCHSAEDGSPQQRRIHAAGDHLRRVRTGDSASVAAQIRADDIDLLIDLKGHTHEHRMDILAYRPAPLQLGYLGYPGSTGAGYLDYLIGDPVVTPLAHAERYSEKIAQLPHSYQPNDSRRALPDAPSRAGLDLPDGAFVFCCFNQSYKLSPTLLDLWAEILRRSPQSVLWLLAWNPAAERNLRREWAARGMEAARLIFAPRLEVDAHLARLRQADLFLDTWPCNAHTTASEALWAGVPVLTVPGESFASRVGASLVQACQLPELVCADARAYVEKAVALAADRYHAKALKKHLDQRRLALPLFDGARYARDMDALLQRLWDRHAQGLAPAAMAAQAAPVAGPAVADLAA